MSNFIDDIVSFGKSAISAVQSNSIASGLAKTAALGFLMYQVTKSTNKSNNQPAAAQLNQKDSYAREQLSPSSTHSIPVVYGDAYVSGKITDAHLADDNLTMWYCVTICEKTGTLMSNSADSVITFKKIYLNESEVTFQSDGITVASITDADGVTDTNVNGMIQIYCFNDGSNSPVVPENYTNINLLFARDVFPTWSANHTMDKLVFAIVKVTYSREKNVTSLGDIKFKLNNTLSMPGDVLYDYMTNTRYGAGIDAAEIYIS